MRPDNLVTLLDGTLILVETEGYADAGQRARVVEKVLHWNACAPGLRQSKTDLKTFLDFHGLRHDHPACRVWVQPPDLDGERGSDFTVAVKLNLTRTREIGEYTNWEEFQRDTGDALGWVLQQLIDYPQVLGIDGAPQDSTSGNSHQKKEKGQ